MQSGHLSPSYYWLLFRMVHIQPYPCQCSQDIRRVSRRVTAGDPDRTRGSCDFPAWSQCRIEATAGMEFMPHGTGCTGMATLAEASTRFAVLPEPVLDRKVTVVVPEADAGNLNDYINKMARTGRTRGGVIRTGKLSMATRFPCPSPCRERTPGG